MVFPPSDALEDHEDAEHIFRERPEYADFPAIQISRSARQRMPWQCCARRRRGRRERSEDGRVSETCFAIG